MNISNSQVNRLRHFVRAGLRSLFRPEPQTAVEWADANYYLPKESAYQEGRWETLPFQRAIMNAMGSDYIREVNVVKSARVGYSKMLLGVYAYFIEHKQRNTLIWLPTDGDAENFMKTHVEPTIRDIPLLLALAPWYGKKHRDNTLTMKRFSNGRGFWCLGGKAAKNYREKSVDVAGYDELAAFDEDIEQEGSPTFLGDKRIEGSVWPKSIRGSTPKVRGTCQIERAASESPHFMRFHVACPHCGEEQYLKFGDKETSFGLKWTPDDPSSVFYLCEHNACVIRQQELDFTDARYICEKTGIWTRDGILWFSSSGEEIEPPDSVTFHIWTAYSPFTTWVQIVKDWMKTKGDTGKRKTFVNTTLGETWEAKIGERPDAEVMAERKGVAMHAFNGELFVQATWDTSSSRLFRTQFRMVSPKRISNPNNTGDSRNCRAGVQINDSGAALGYYVSEDGYPGWMPQKWTWIPRELPGGRASFIHVFEPVEDGQTRGANVFYSVMEQMKMLDTLQNTQLQSAIVKAMYAATIESELDTQSAMDFILGANSQEQRERLTGWIGEIAAYYAAAPVRLGGAKVPHLMPGDSLNLQTAQDTDNGYSVFEQSLLRYIAAGLGVSYEQLSRNYAQMSYSTARASANESWAHFMGRRKFVASRQASQMFLCWLEEAIVRRVVTLPSKARFSFQEARSAWGNCDWIGSGRMAIDGLKEVQEAVMLIEAGLSTYEKECAKRGDDYQEIFAQQVRETMERREAGLKPPAWAAAAFESGLRQSTEEEKSDSRAA
ncbi:phage terminase large subunit [Escherichia coli]|nr:phage portal protein [Escherichia coli]GCO98183.1 phage terminase large subunit [Escherichia coli]